MDSKPQYQQTATYAPVPTQAVPLMQPYTPQVVYAQQPTYGAIAPQPVIQQNTKMVCICACLGRVY